MSTREYLVLTRGALRALGAMLPYGRTADELSRALDSRSGGCLSVLEVRQLRVAAREAVDAPDQVVKRGIALAVVAELSEAIDAVDVERLERAGRPVPIFMRDPLRDGEYACEPIASTLTPPDMPRPAPHGIA
jgi:hypothetical protein